MLEAVSIARRLLARRAFMAERLTAFEGLASLVETASGTASKTPTFAAQFERWARRARRAGRASAPAFAEIARRLGEGQGLSRSMKPFIPPDEAMIIDAGEASGKLQITLESLVRSARARQEMHKAAREAYAVPLVNLLAFIALSIYSGLALWPQLLAALPPRHWDAWALPMIHAQVWLTGHWWSLGAFAALYAAYRWSLANWSARARALAERFFPPYAAYRDRQAAALLIGLAGLLRAGQTMDQALARLSRQGSPYMRAHTRAIRQRLIRHAGEPARVLATGIFSDAILERIDNAAASRQLAEAVQHIGADALAHVVESVKRASWLGANVMVAVVSLLIAYYAAVQALAAPMAANRLMQEVNSGARVH